MFDGSNPDKSHQSGYNFHSSHELEFYSNTLQHSALRTWERLCHRVPFSSLPQQRTQVLPDPVQQ